MRTRTSPERALIAGANVNHHLRVEVENGSRTFVDLTDLEGVDWVDACEWGEEVDSPIGSFTLSVRRDSDSGAEMSAAPTMGYSPLNRDDAMAYAPLLYPGRNIRISTAVVALGDTPSGGDWKEMFYGVIDDVAWHASPIVVTGRDIGGWLVDAFTGSLLGYVPAESGAEDIEDVMQDLLDTYFNVGAPGLPPITLYTPVSPSFAIDNSVAQKPVDNKSLMEVLQQDYALLIGWSLRFRYDSSGDFRLTFYDPDRTRTDVDDTFGPNEYSEIPNLAVNGLDVRNFIVGIFYDVSGVRTVVTAEDTASATAYGSKYMEIALAPGDPINTEAEMQALIDAALSDLKDAPASHEMRTLYYWPAQLGDRYTYSANDDHYDDAQTLATVGYRHHFENGEAWTNIQARGTVAGHFHAWHRGRHGIPLPTGSSEVRRPGIIEIIPTLPTNAGVPPVTAWGWEIAFKLHQFVDFTSETTAPKHFGADFTQQPISSLSGGDLPSPVTVTFQINDLTPAEWRPEYESTTDVFSLTGIAPLGAKLTYNITAPGNTYTSAFDGPKALPAPLLTPPAESRVTLTNASAYLSNNRVFNMEDYYDAASRTEGTTDDATAFGVAMAAAYGANGRSYLEIPGVLATSSDLECYRTVTLIGPGVGPDDDSRGIISLGGTVRNLFIRGGDGGGVAKHLIRDLFLNAVRIRYGAVNTDHGRGCQLDNVFVYNCDGYAAVEYGYNSYITRIRNCHFSGNKYGVYFNFALAGSGSGSNMVIRDTVIDLCEDCVVVNGATTDGHDIVIDGCDLEHATVSALRTISAGDGRIHINSCNMELLYGYYIVNDGANIWLTNQRGGSEVDTAMFKQTAGRIFVSGGRTSFAANKLAEIHGGEIVIDPTMLMMAGRLFSESAVMVPPGAATPGFVANIAMAVSGSDGGRITLGAGQTFRAQIGVKVTTLTNASPGPERGSLWWSMDGNNRSFRFSTIHSSIGTDNVLRVYLNNGVSSVYLDIACALFAGIGVFCATYMPGVLGTAGTFTIYGVYTETASEKARGFHLSTAVSASDVLYDRELAFQTVKAGATATQIIVDNLEELVSGPSSVGL